MLVASGISGVGLLATSPKAPGLVAIPDVELPVATVRGELVRGCRAAEENVDGGETVESVGARAVEVTSTEVLKISGCFVEETDACMDLSAPVLGVAKLLAVVMVCKVATDSVMGVALS